MSEPSENALDDMFDELFERLQTHPVWGQTTRIAMTPIDKSDDWDDTPRDPSAIKAKLTSEIPKGLGLGPLLDGIGDRETRRNKRKRSECYPFPDYR